MRLCSGAVRTARQPIDTFEPPNHSWPLVRGSRMPLDATHGQRQQSPRLLPSSTNETLASPGPPMALHRRRSRSASLEIPSRGQGRRKRPETDGQSSTRAACAAQCGGKVPEPIIIIQPTPQRVAPCGLPGSGPGGASPFFGGKGGVVGGWGDHTRGTGTGHRNATAAQLQGAGWGLWGSAPYFAWCRFRLSHWLPLVSHRSQHHAVCDWPRTAAGEISGLGLVSIAT